MTPKLKRSVLMSNLKRIAVNRRVVLAALLLLALTGVFAAGSPAEAQTRCGTEIYYFSDASHTTDVGLRGWLPSNCGCASYGWGSITIYREIYDSVC
jgi:hypothetical protein